MKREQIQIAWGADLYKYVELGIEQAKANNTEVEFEFNGINVVVNGNTKKENITRDYFNAHLINWREIGPISPDNYTNDVQIAINKAKLKQEEEEAARQKVYREEEKRKREEFNKLVEGIEIEFSNKENWDKGIAAQNGDGYGLACFTYAENWAKLMQKHMSEGKTLEEVADADSHVADTEGITGFMYGMAVNILSKCWKYGEQLRIWHNKQYNQEGEGVVNPAVITIKTKD